MSRIAQLAAMVTAAGLMAASDAGYGNSADDPWRSLKREPEPLNAETRAAVDAIRADRARRKAENFAKRQAK